MSNLMDHAQIELELLGEEPETVKGYLAMIEVFEKMGHSGGSAAVFIPTLGKLLSYENLTPITDDPQEWMHISPEMWPDPEAVWQSRRNSALFSTDSGKTYYHVDDRSTIHTSQHKESK